MFSYLTRFILARFSVIRWEVTVSESFKGDDLRFLIVHIGHRSAYAGIDEGGVADDVLAVVVHQIVACHVFIKSHCRGEVPGIIEENDIQSDKVANQTREKDSAVFTVTIRIIERLLRKESAVAAAYRCHTNWGWSVTLPSAGGLRARIINSFSGYSDILSPKNVVLIVYVTFYHLKSLYLFVPMWFIGV